MAHQLTDPVCGMQVDSAKNAMEYQGVNYAFCSPHCREKFAGEPDKYVSDALAKQPKDGSCCS